MFKDVYLNILLIVTIVEIHMPNLHVNLCHEQKLLVHDCFSIVSTVQTLLNFNLQKQTASIFNCVKWKSVNQAATCWLCPASYILQVLVALLMCFVNTELQQ